MAQSFGDDIYIDGGLESEDDITTIGGRFVSTLPDGGDSPLSVLSQILNVNLNTDLLDGYHAIAFPRKAENATISGNWLFSDAPKVTNIGTDPLSLATLSQITGSVAGTVGYHAKFTGANSIGNSIISESGYNINIGGGTSTQKEILLDDAYNFYRLRIASQVSDYTLAENAIFTSSGGGAGIASTNFGRMMFVGRASSGVQGGFAFYTAYDSASAALIIEPDNSTLVSAPSFKWNGNTIITGDGATNKLTKYASTSSITASGFLSEESNGLYFGSSISYNPYHITFRNFGSYTDLKIGGSVTAAPATGSLIGTSGGGATYPFDAFGRLVIMDKGADDAQGGIQFFTGADRSYYALAINTNRTVSVNRQLISNLTTGTAPFSVASTTNVTNLNADLLDGLHASSFSLAATIITINGIAYDLSANRTWSVGTVTSVAMSVPTGLSISGSPIETSGTLALSFTAGYSIPTTTKQSEWDTAYGWGNPAGVYAPVSHTHTFASLTSKPTTLSGYGITDGIGGSGTAGYHAKFTGASTIGNSIISESGNVITIGDSGASGKRINFNNTYDFYKFSILTAVTDYTDYNSAILVGSGSGTGKPYDTYGGLGIAGQLANNANGSIYFLTGSSRNLALTIGFDNISTFTGVVASTVTTGTAPLTIASVTLVGNLNADLLDNQHGAYYLDYNNFTNKPTIPSLSGYATESWVTSNFVTPSSSNTFTNKGGNISQWTNNSGYITGINSGMVTGALGYTPYNSSNPSGYISGISSGNVTSALGYTPIPNSRTITINGNSQYLNDNPSYTISGGIGGSGTSGYVTMWGGGGITNSRIYDGGVGAVTVSADMSISASIIVSGDIYGSSLLVGGGSLHSSCAFQVNSTTKGSVFSPMTQAQRLAISSPRDGLFVYETDVNPGYWQRRSGSWNRLGT